MQFFAYIFHSTSWSEPARDGYGFAALILKIATNISGAGRFPDNCRTKFYLYFKKRYVRRSWSGCDAIWKKRVCHLHSSESIKTNLFLEYICMYSSTQLIKKKSSCVLPDYATFGIEHLTPKISLIKVQVKECLLNFQLQLPEKHPVPA